MFNFFCRKPQSTSTKIIIGLGNPGEKYERTRHNAGFLFIDFLREAWSFDDFVFNKKFNADVSEGVRSGTKTLLVKPQTFMNHSGDSVQKIVDFYKVSVKNIVIVHDELDLPLGDYKISDNSRAAGHNGVQDIFNRLDTKEIKRIRLGVDNRDQNIRKNISGSNYVLQNFSEGEFQQLQNLFPEIEEEV